VTHELNGDIVSIRVTPPHVGQFGLDVYAQPLNASHKGIVAHVCKYLLNCTFVASPVDLQPSNGSVGSPVGGGGGGGGGPDLSAPAQPPTAAPTGATAIVPGPRPAFAEYGLKTLSHPDPVVQKLGRGASVAIEIGHPESVQVSGRLTRTPGGTGDELPVGEKTKGKKTKFTIALPGDGTYSLALYAAQRNDLSHSANVYNYVIEHREDDAKKKRK